MMSSPSRPDTNRISIHCVKTQLESLKLECEAVSCPKKIEKKASAGKRSRSVFFIDNLTDVLVDLDYCLTLEGTKELTIDGRRPKMRRVQREYRTCGSISSLTSHVIKPKALPIYEWSKEVIGMLKSSKMSSVQATAIEGDLSKLLRLIWGRLSRFQTETPNDNQSICKVYHQDKSCNRSFRYDPTSSCSNDCCTSPSGGFCTPCLRQRGEWVGVCGDCQDQHSLKCHHDECLRNSSWMCHDCTKSCTVCRKNFCSIHMDKDQTICKGCIIPEMESPKENKTKHWWYYKWIELFKSIDNVKDAQEIEKEVSKLVKLAWGRIHRFSVEGPHPEKSVCREPNCQKLFVRGKRRRSLGGGFCGSCMKETGEWTGVCYSCSKANDPESNVCICSQCANALRQKE